MARESAEQRREREAVEAAAQPRTTDPLDREATATDDAPEGVRYGEPRLDESSHEERPYASALTPEHAQVLRDAGQHPDEQ